MTRDDQNQATGSEPVGMALYAEHNIKTEQGQ